MGTHQLNPSDGNPAAVEVISGSVEQTVELGRRLAGVLRAGDVVGLNGSLGAGKTQLVRGVAEGFGVDPRCVSSPTFVLMCEYDPRKTAESSGASTAAAPTVVHIDAYRMQGLSDLESIGWGEELFDNAVTLIEWADRIAGHLPADHLWISLEHREDNQRLITLEPRGSFARRISALREAAAAVGRQSVCPSCGKPVETTAASYPFCTNRCRMADLNKWFNGGYSIGTPLHEIDDDSDLE